MKKILSIIITLFVIYGCSNPVDNSNGQDTNTGEVSFTLPSGSRGYTITPSSYTIQLVNTEISYDNSVTGKPGETLSIKKLLPGDYTISAKGFDAESNEIMKGNSSVTVEVGKVAVAKIELEYTSGGINVELDLPALIEEPSTIPRRVKRSGPGVFTYDENGVVSKVDVKASWADYYIVYSIEDGKRTGAEYYYRESEYVLKGEEYVLEYKSEEYVLTYKSTIEHDASGREIKETKYQEVDGAWEINSTITVNFDDVENTKKVTDENNRSKVERTYDRLGREIERVTKGSMPGFGWLSYYGGSSSDGTDYSENIFTKKISYYKDTWLTEKEEMYMDDELVTTTDFVVDDLGFYVHGEVTTKDRSFVQSLSFSPLFELGDYFAQTLMTSEARAVSGTPIQKNYKTSVLTYKYTRDFTHSFTTDWVVTFEEGERKYDLIEPTL